jgi:hypothetical protein
VAERLKTSPSHEAVLYSASSRLSLLDQLVADDLGMNVDDLELLVQEEDAQTPGKFNLVSHTIAELRNADAKKSIYTNIQRAGLVANADESGVFSAGITALDHHSIASSSLWRPRHWARSKAAWRMCGRQSRK